MARRLRRNEYTVGWVCALPVELAAALEMLDEEHHDLERDPTDNDENLYALGSISGHNVAIVCLPAGRIGNNPAASVSTQMRATFKAIRFGLMVGIGGGVPSAEVDIRLGDVVVSQPHKVHDGVVQYDVGKTTPSGFEWTGSLNSPPQVLLSAVAKMRANELRGRSQLSTYVSKLERIPKFQRVKAGPDILFEAAYDHVGGHTCDQCSVDRHEVRQPRESEEEEVAVYYGTIASGNQVMRSAAERDRLSAELGGVLCFEMEAAGLMNSFPCLVIRGICDYADSHKNKLWQPYAAATAAAYAKELLSIIPAAEVAKAHTVEEAIRDTVGPQKEAEGLSEDCATVPPLDEQSNGLNRVLQLEEAVLRHMKLNDPRSQLECRTPDGKSISGQAANHRVTPVKPGNLGFPCKTCAKTFNTQGAANDHMRAAGHEIIPCKRCPRTFNTQSAVNDHMRGAGHDKPNISCKKCPKKFFTQSAANDHMRGAGHDKPNISCKSCAKKFYTQIAANQHITATKHGSQTTASHTHLFSNKIWSSTAKGSEVITDATDHTTQDSAFEAPNEARKTSSPELSLARTIYAPSATLTTPARGDRGYIGELAEQLFGVVNCPGLSRDALDRVSRLLPDLLRAFAVQVGYQAPSPMHRDVMYYVRKDRVSVQQSFQRLVDDASKSEEPAKADEGLGKDAIDRFMKDTEEYDDVPEQQLPAEAVDLEQNQKQQDDSPEKGMMFDFILQTPAYKWLVATLKRETTLMRANPDLMEEIGAEIRGMLPSYGEEVSRKASSPEYKATFELLWNPLQYVKDQKYDESPEEVLKGAITLNGTVDDAQVLTALDYLCQVWPASGTHIMQLVTDVACNISGRFATASLSDGTELQARIDAGRLTVIAVGSSEALAEAGQQFAWLGAALRSSPVETGIAHCVPYIRKCHQMQAGLSVEPSEQRRRGEIFCQFGFKVRASNTMGTEGPGRCWHNMFTNPILVGGYPICSKPESGLGIEMPLDLLAGLVGASQVVGIQGKVVLKGFATMLVAVKRLGDLLIWHFLFDEDGKRISYLDFALEEACDMNVHQLDDVRHVVGWSRDSSYYAGARDARYDVEGTNLPSPHPGAMLEKLTINLGKVFTAGATFAPRVRHISPHFVRDVYEQKLMWIEKKYVVLWDEKTKRGWLVNGTSALLHLVRMSLRLYKKGNYSDGLLFDESKMHNATGHEPESAAKVLKDESNRKLEVWRGRSEGMNEEEWKSPAGQEVRTYRKRKISSYLFENLVEQKWSVLELLIESHKQPAILHGINLKLRFRKHLEGWDFEDLAGESDPEPRVATLKAVGYGWVEFVRSIQAITLFGSGFGDIIMPSKDERICPQWSQLPNGEYHLAASMFDMNNIMSRCRKTHNKGIEVVRGLLWHSPTDPFIRCKCQRQANSGASPESLTKHHNPVQALFPKRSMLYPRPRKPENLSNSGAVIFGHIRSWGPGFGVDETSDISTEKLRSLCPSDSQEAALEPDISMMSLSLIQSSSTPFKSTYGGITHPLCSANTGMTTPEESTSRHTGSSPTTRWDHVNNSSDEEVENDADNWGKMWWETCYPRRYVPTIQAAAGNLATCTQTCTLPRSPPDSHPKEDCQTTNT